MFRALHAVGRGASRLRLGDTRSGSFVVTDKTGVGFVRGFASGTSDASSKISWQSVAVGAAAIAAAYEGARTFEPTAQMEAPKTGVKNTDKPPTDALKVPLTTPPKQADKPSSDKDTKPEKAPVAKSDSELFFAQLLSQRKVFLNGRVDDKSAHGLIGKLLFLDQIDPETPIILYINSGGGVVTSGLAIYDVMMHIRPPVYTVVIGHAESMAAVLLSAGEKGKRYALPNSRIMIHQPHHVISGQTTEILIKSKKAERTRKTLADILISHTNRSEKEVGDALERDTYMSASEAVKFGIVDKEIVSVDEIGK